MSRAESQDIHTVRVPQRIFLKQKGQLFQMSSHRYYFVIMKIIEMKNIYKYTSTHRIFVEQLDVNAVIHHLSSNSVQHDGQC